MGVRGATRCAATNSGRTGGIRTPLIVAWLQQTDPGAIRTQYVHVIDLAPTLLQAAGAGFHKAVNGQIQIPVAGRSMMSTIVSAQAASLRSVQFFELWGTGPLRRAGGAR